MNLLLVVADQNSLTATDTFTHDRLVTLGHTVTYINDETAAPDLSGYNGVVFARTAAAVGTKYDATTKPVLSFLIHPHTGAGGTLTNGVAQDTEYVIPASDAIVTGGPNSDVTILSGNTVVYNYTLTTGLGSGVVTMAVGGSSQLTRALCYRYDSGAQMATGTAPSRRCRMGMMDMTKLTSTGLTWFDNALTWTFAGTSSAPVNTALPTVSGTVAVGQTLTASGGTWTGAPTPTLSYRWQSSPDGTTWTNLAATSTTYTIQAADNWKLLRVQVTGTNSAGTTTVSSAATARALGAYLEVNVGGVATKCPLFVNVGGAAV